MAAKKRDSVTPSETQFKDTSLLPSYANNARIQVTSDNVFIDFGFMDPFDTLANSKSEVVSRVVMNRSTFATFIEHLSIAQSSISPQTKDGSVPVVIMSRCPSKVDPSM